MTILGLPSLGVADPGAASEDTNYAEGGHAGIVMGAGASDPADAAAGQVDAAPARPMTAREKISEAVESGYLSEREGRRLLKRIHKKGMRSEIEVDAILIRKMIEDRERVLTTSPPLLYMRYAPRDASERTKALWKQSVILTHLNIQEIGGHLARLKDARMDRREKRAQRRRYRRILKEERAALKRLSKAAPAEVRAVETRRSGEETGAPSSKVIVVQYGDGTSETLTMKEVLAPNTETSGGGDERSPGQ